MLEHLQALVDDLVRDVVGRLGEPSRDRAIGLAVVQFGKDRPRAKASDLTATTVGQVRMLDLPDGWVIGDSKALSIEYPIGLTPPATIGRHLWDMLLTPDGPAIGLPTAVVDGQKCRLTWTLPHELSDTTDTIAIGDREAVAQYAASILLGQLATLASGDTSSTIKSDSVEHGEKGPNYGKRQADALDRYHKLLGIDPKRTQPASVTVAPPLASTTGEDRLLFRRGRRW